VEYLKSKESSESSCDTGERGTINLNGGTAIVIGGTGSACAAGGGGAGVVVVADGFGWVTLSVSFDDNATGGSLTGTNGRDVRGVWQEVLDCAVPLASCVCLGLLLGTISLFAFCCAFGCLIDLLWGGIWATQASSKTANITLLALSHAFVNRRTVAAVGFHWSNRDACGAGGGGGSGGALSNSTCDEGSRENDGGELQFGINYVFGWIILK